jgi:hypothetical protein
MNSIHRVGLTIAAAIAILTVAGALLVEGYVSTHTAAAAPTASQVVATDSPTDAATATPSLEPQTIYIQPVPTPAIVTITHAAPPAVVSKPKAPPPVIHVVVTAPPGSGDDGGSGDN